MRLPVTVIVKHRILGDGRIWLDRVKTKVLRDTGGWYAVESPFHAQDARVLFRPAQDMVVIEQSGQFLRVPFVKGEGEFVWEDRTYRIGSMVLGEIRIDQESREAARGVVTTTGIRIDRLATELLPIVRALAWGLTLRSEELSRDGFRNRDAAPAG